MNINIFKLLEYASIFISLLLILFFSKTNNILNMNSKDTEVLWGPETSLSNIIKKRIKRRSVQLVRKID